MEGVLLSRTLKRQRNLIVNLLMCSVTQVPHLDTSAHFMDDIVVSKDWVTKFLKGLNPSKTFGPDELHPRVLKESAIELGPVFADFCSKQLTLVKSQGNGLLQIFALFSRRMTGQLRTIIGRFPWLVYLARYSNTYYVQISWPIWININSCQLGNMHSGEGIVVKLRWRP